jgi:hypothetical protein
MQLLFERHRRSGNAKRRRRGVKLAADGCMQDLTRVDMFLERNLVDVFESLTAAHLIAHCDGEGNHFVTHAIDCDEVELPTAGQGVLAVQDGAYRNSTPRVALLTWSLSSRSAEPPPTH